METNDMNATGGANRCPRCGKTFTCGMQAGQERCWCSEMPTLPAPYRQGKGCFCPDCLKELTSRPPDPA